MKGKQEQERVVATWLWKVILNKTWKENKYNYHTECRLLRETLGCCMKSVCFNTAGFLIKMQKFLDPERPIFLLWRLDYDSTFFTQLHDVLPLPYLHINKTCQSLSSWEGGPGLGRRYALHLDHQPPHSSTTVALVSIQLAQHKEGPLRNFTVSSN